MCLSLSEYYRVSYSTKMNRAMATRRNTCSCIAEQQVHHSASERGRAIIQLATRPTPTQQTQSHYPCDSQRAKMLHHCITRCCVYIHGLVQRGQGLSTTVSSPAGLPQHPQLVWGCELYQEGAKEWRWAWRWLRYEEVPGRTGSRVRLPGAGTCSVSRHPWVSAIAGPPSEPGREGW